MRYLRRLLTWVDPDQDPKAWLDVGWSSIENVKQLRANARFIVDHWHSNGQPDSDRRHRLYSCDRFDPQTRLCTAHEDRPPICRGFPYYGRETITVDLPEQCSYRDDWQPVTFKAAM